MNEHISADVRCLFPPKSEAARAQVLAFARSAPLKPGNWRELKWLYKQAESTTEDDVLATLIARFDATEFAQQIEGPSDLTIGYMKRRARRYLRALGQSDPDRYTQLAQRVLATVGADRPLLDIGFQWVSADILFGGSDRVQQRSRGRGLCVLQPESAPPRLREERFPVAWDGRSDLVERLYTLPDLPWQTYEFALNVLLANGVAVPGVDERVLAQLLRSGSPLLVDHSVHVIAATLQQGSSVDAALVAEAFFLGHGGVSRQIRAHFALRRANSDWDAAFVARSIGLLGERFSRGGLIRRQIHLARLLADEMLSECS